MALAAARDPDQREFRFTDRDFRFLATIVRERTGIVLGEHKRNLVYSRLARRLRALGIDSFKAYCELIRGPQGDAELADTINAITTNLTRFFRESHHFDHLRNTVVPALKERATTNGSRRARIWSAGCSTGEEPFSIALTLISALPDHAQWNLRILATDLDTQALAKGCAATYRAADLTEAPNALRKTHPVNGEGVGGAQVQFDDAVRKLIVFNQLNLLGHWPMKGPFDVIFCRNVVIYFDRETKRKLVQRFVNLLRPGGWLYLGHSESLVSTDCPLVSEGRTIYRKIS